MFDDAGEGESGAGYIFNFVGAQEGIFSQPFDLLIGILSGGDGLTIDARELFELFLLSEERFDHVDGALACRLEGEDMGEAFDGLIAFFESFFPESGGPQTVAESVVVVEGSLSESIGDACEAVGVVVVFGDIGEGHESGQGVSVEFDAILSDADGVSLLIVVHVGGE